MNANYKFLLKYEREYNCKTNFGCIYARLYSPKSIIDLDYSINYIIKGKRLMLYKIERANIYLIDIFANIKKS